MMKASIRRHSITRAVSPRRAQQPAHLAHEPQWVAAPDLFSGREDDAAEMRALLLQFEHAHDEVFGFENFH